MEFFEASAKTNHNVTEIFTFLTEKIMETNQPTTTQGQSLEDSKKKEKKRGFC